MELPPRVRAAAADGAPAPVDGAGGGGAAAGDTGQPCVLSLLPVSSPSLSPSLALALSLTPPARFEFSSLAANARLFHLEIVDGRPCKLASVSPPLHLALSPSLSSSSPSPSLTHSVSTHSGQPRVPPKPFPRCLPLPLSIHPSLFARSSFPLSLPLSSAS